MPIRAQALTMHYFATDADGPKTGDVGNHALRIIEDGVVGTIAASPAEIDATNAPGIYKVAITGAENTADVVTLCGKSSTSGVTLSPSTWCNITNADAAVATNSGKLDTIDNFIDTEVAAILVDTGTTLAAAIAGVDSLAGAISSLVTTVDGIVDAILVDTDTTIPALLSTLSGKVDAIDDLVDTEVAAIKTVVDSILVDTAVLGATPIAANVTEVSGSSTAADNLEAGALTVVSGEVDSSTAPTTTTFNSEPGGLSSTDDFYNGRLIIFTSGTLTNQAREITDYTGSTKIFTTEPWTTAAANNNTFIII